MKHARRLILLSLLVIVSCRETQLEPPGDMSTDAPDIMDSSTDDASTDMPTDQSVDMSPPADRRICITEDAQRCAVQKKTQFGACDNVIGAVFDGRQCVEAKGCPNCQGDDCPMFDSIESCASSCAQNGWCQTQKMLALPLPQPPCSRLNCVEPLVACIVSETDPTNQLAVFGRDRVMPECLEKDTRGFCRVSQVDCGDKGQWCCHYRLSEDSLISEEVSQVCALTLEPKVQQVGCIFFAE